MKDLQRLRGMVRGAMMGVRRNREAKGEQSPFNRRMQKTDRSVQHFQPGQLDYELAVVRLRTLI